MTRCPACGATNPEAATWCGQCYRRFDDELSEPSANGAAVPTSAQAPTVVSPAPAAAVREPSDTPAGFRRTGDVLEWECPQCGQFNGMELTACAVCGTSFLQRFHTEEAAEPPRNWTAALLLSAVLPGAGHLSVGRYGTGWARLLLAVAWLVGAVALGTSAGSGALVVAAPLLLGVAVLWVLSLVDLLRLQQGQSELLAGRTFLWLVVGVLLLMVAALFGSAGLAQAPSPDLGG